MPSILTAPYSNLRQLAAGRRNIRHSLGIATAAEAVGPITPGCEIFGLTGGQFSLIDLLGHCLDCARPATLDLSTWTAAVFDIGVIHKRMMTGDIMAVRFLLDYSYKIRQPESFAALAEGFGVESMRMTENHCKFAVIRGPRLNLAIRSTMNLNDNRRLESFEISDDADFAGLLSNTMDLFFAEASGAVSSDRKPNQHTKAYDKIVGAGPGARDTENVKKYFGKGRFDQDVSRVGLIRGSCHG